MGKIDNYVTFVKDQITVQEKLANKFLDESYRRSLHLKTANSFVELAKFLEDIQSRGTEDVSYLNRGDSPLKRLLITYEDIDGAPDDLLRELNITDTDKQELLIEYMIAKAGGILSLDKIIVELYKKTRDVPKRNTLTSRLYRMVDKGMIYNVPGKKGVYSTYEVTEQEAKQKFGQDQEATEPAQANPPSQPAQRETLTAPDRVKTRLLGSASMLRPR